MADESDEDRFASGDGSDWERGIDRPAGDSEAGTEPRPSVEIDGESDVDGIGRKPAETAAAGTTNGDPAAGQDRTAPARSVPDPVALPPETDPTGAGWWRVLTILTGVAVAGFFLWPLLSPILSVSEATAGTRFDTVGAVLGLAPLVLLVLVRFVALPVALWRDATLLRSSDADWTPSRAFYMTAGAVWASLTCAYYLYKRSRYTGRPSLPLPASRLHFSGRRIASNWYLVVGLAMLLVPLGTGFDALLDAVEAVPGGDVLGAILAMVFFGLLAVGFVLLPVAFYRDCQAVRDADVDWQPTTWFYVVVGYLLTLPVGAYYLYKRSQIESL